MAHYVVLIELQGREIGDDAEADKKADALPDVMDRIVEAWNANGSGAQVYATMGAYDLVIVGEVNSDEAMAWLGVQLAARGLKVQSLKAFTADEMRGVCALPANVRSIPVRPT